MNDCTEKYFFFQSSTGVIWGAHAFPLSWTTPYNSPKSNLSYWNTSNRFELSLVLGRRQKKKGIHLTVGLQWPCSKWHLLSLLCQYKYINKLWQDESDILGNICCRAHCLTFMGAGDYIVIGGFCFLGLTYVWSVIKWKDKHEDSGISIPLVFLCQDCPRQSRTHQWCWCISLYSSTYKLLKNVS